MPAAPELPFPPSAPPAGESPRAPTLPHETPPEALSAAVRGALRPRDPGAVYDAAAAVRAMERSRTRVNPLRGRTAGELAEFYDPFFLRQQAELAAAKSGLEETTELRETFRESGAYHWPDRGAMMRAARSITGLRNHRLQVCMRGTSRNAKTGPDGAPRVEVVAPADGGTPRYRGVMLCEHAWTCPSCAPRITEARRRELAGAAQRHRNQGGAVLLFTLTFSHGPMTELKGKGAAWDLLGKALQRFAQCAPCKAFRELAGWSGRVRAREITFGINGWHPHAHTLEFVNADACTPELVAEWSPKLKAAWRRCCAAVGLEASTAHGFDVSLTDVDDYIAKWGAAAELTKWHVKRGTLELEADGEGTLNGLSPFDLLRIVAGVLVPDERLKLNRDRAAALFTDYANAVKGTAQLHWTRGLKKSLVPEPDGDEEKPELLTLGELRPDEWRILTRCNRQCEFLGLVDVHGFDVARRFLDTWAREWRSYDRIASGARSAERGLAYLFRGGP